MTTATVDFLSNDRTGAQASVKATATIGTVRIGLARTSNELSACGSRGGGSRCGTRRGIAGRFGRGDLSGCTRWFGSVGSGDGDSSVIVWFRISMSTPTVDFLSNDRSGAQASVKTTATIGAIRIGFARTSDELSTLGGGSARSSTGFSGCSTGRSLSGCSCLDRSAGGFGCIGTSYSNSGVVVGFRISMSATTIVFLRNNGASTKTGVETTTAICAIGICAARPGDELGASSRKASSRCGRRDRC